MSEKIDVNPASVAKQSTYPEEMRRFETTRSMPSGRARKRPEILNGLYKQCVQELAYAIFEASNQHEVAVTTSTKVNDSNGRTTILVGAIVRSVNQAVDQPFAFDTGEPLKEIKTLSDWAKTSIADQLTRNEIFEEKDA
jgi:hypothetical protein